MDSFKEAVCGGFIAHRGTTPMYHSPIVAPLARLPHELGTYTTETM